MGEIITINIESDDLRFLVANGKGILRWGSVPLEPGIVREGLIMDPEALNAVIDELISSQRLKKGRAVASLSGIQSVHRIISLPRMSKKLMEQAIESEAKRVMPVSLEQIYLSSHGLSEKKDPLQKFFLLGVPQNMMDEEVACLRQSGIDPLRMNLKPVALARMVNRADALIIDVESDCCSIIIVSGGVPVIMRSVVMLSDYSALDRAQYILHEFERTLQFYESSFVDNQLKPETPLFLTGKLAGDEDLYQAVSSAAGYSVEPLTSALTCPAEFPINEYAVNMGLALKNTSLSAKKAAEDGRFMITNLNILPEVYRPKTISRQKALAIAGFMVGLAVIFPLYQLVDSAEVEASELRAQNSQLQQDVFMRDLEKNDLAEQMDAVKATIAQMEAEQQTIADLNFTLDGMRQIRQRAYDATVLAMSLAPSRITLNSISQEQDTLSLDGETVIAAAEGGGVITEFNIQLTIRDENTGPISGQEGDYPWYNGNDTDYDGYKLILSYGDDLRDESQWFSNVEVHTISVRQYDADAEA